MKIHYGKEFGKDLTEESLLKDGFGAIFIGVGLNAPKSIFKTPIHPNVFSSKTFLPNVC